ncbi:MAG: hypothetical protein SGCHY_002247 [Lobulomycetales sp.]
MPVILVTGTPGCGKTTACQLISSASGLSHIDVSKFALQHKLHLGRNEHWDTHILDEDALLDMLEPIIEKGNCIIDFHSPGLFPERWFDLVVVLMTDNAVLYPRLQARGYSEQKCEENIDCEIFGVVREEAMESYEKERVVCLQSDTIEHMDENVERVLGWIEAHAAALEH